MKKMVESVGRHVSAKPLHPGFIVLLLWWIILWVTCLFLYFIPYGKIILLLALYGLVKFKASFASCSILCGYNVYAWNLVVSVLHAKVQSFSILSYENPNCCWLAIWIREREDGYSLPPSLLDDEWHDDMPAYLFSTPIWVTSYSAFI